jgi:hypothetical protein
MKNPLIYPSILFILILLSCKKEQIGASLNDINGPVTITTALSASNASPNFSTGGSIYFNAAFQNDASWVLTLTGNVSGAVKIFTGVGKSIDASNSSWNGSSGNIYSFQVEPVIAKLTFPSASSSTPQQITINIAAVRTLGSQGVIVSDFSAHHAGWTSDWPYSDSYSGPAIPTPYPDGNKVLYMTGNPWQGTPVSPYVDYFKITASAADVNYGTYFPLYADPNQVYLNFDLYNTYNPFQPVDSVNNPYTWFQVTVIEEGNIGRSYNIKNPTWTGWKQFSIKYTDFVSTNTSPLQPNKVLAVQLVLLSTYNLSDQTGLKKTFVSTAVDHLIFTNGEPYKP